MNPFEMVAMLGTLSIISFTVIRIIQVVANRRQHALPSDQMQRIEDRLARMEQGIDAMAVEVERISEGQRFTTKLLAERAAGGAPG